MRRRWWTVFLIALLAGTASRAQTLDRIIAVVDEEVILQSELEAQLQFFALNNRVDPSTPGLRDQVLESMITERLIIAKAREDSVTVTDEEVQKQLDMVLQQRIQQVGSEARLDEIYGMPISRIRLEFRDEMRKNLIAQKLQQQRFSETSIGRRAVEQFYRTYQDSLPRVPEEVELSHILIIPSVSDAARQATRNRLVSLRDSILAGADFADIARRHSEDPGSAPAGGDLGLVRRGLFVKEFEGAVFSLDEGQISDIVETPFGLHLIQLLERRGDAVRARHILLRMERTPVDDDSARATLARLRERALAGESFAELARQYSQDEQTRLVGGELGVFEIDDLDPELARTVDGVQEGEITPPSRISVGSSYGFHIVQVKRRTAPHEMSLEQDYRKLEALAMNYKRVQDYQDWIAELKKQIYWKIYL